MKWSKRKDVARSNAVRSNTVRRNTAGSSAVQSSVIRSVIRNGVIRNAIRNGVIRNAIRNGIIRSTIIRSSAVVLSAALLISSMPGVPFYAEADMEIIVIKTAEDFEQFSKNCSSEAFSQGKTVRLEADIVLSGREFRPVPVFAGTFEGNGHTISGITIEQKGSNLGLFRYLEEDAVVQDLRVEGEIKPDGSRKNIGGIAGTNKGTIRGCTFSGTAQALESLGGIAGVNEETGVIEDCRNEAELTGNRKIGGIAGENEGKIVSSHNEGEVNASPEGVEENSEGMSNISIDRETIEETVIREKINDVGGIAGFSSGTIRQCSNRAQIGYDHAGYNVGGIVGRQNGVLMLCENEGTVAGRKDVGGIAGQLEPFLTVYYGKDTFDKINDQVDRLSDTTDSMTEKLWNTTDTSVGNLDRIDEIMKEIKNITRNKKDERRIKRDDFGDQADHQLDVIDEILAEMEFDLSSRDAQRAAGRVRANVEKSKDLLKQLENGGSDVADGVGEAIGGAIGGAGEAVSGVVGGITGQTGGAGQTAGGASGAAGEVSQSAGEAGGAAGEVSGDVGGTGENTSGAGGNFSDSASSVIEGVTGGAGQGGSGAGLGDILDSIGSIGDDIIIDEDAGVLGQLQYLLGILEELQECAEGISSDTDIMITRGIDGIVDGVRDFEDDLDSLRIASKELLDLTRDYKDQLIDDVDELDADVTGRLDQLYDELDSLSDTLKDGKTQLRGEKERLDTQLDEMQDIVTEGRDRVRSERDKLEDDEESLFEDISENVTDLSNGMILACSNRGAVFSDYQAGGVVGTIGVEIDLDPEEDIESYGDKSLYMDRYASAAVRECRNDGYVVAQKDYAGGIAGTAKLGVLASNQNYGDISAIDGDYAGGIAGSSQSTVSGSYVMCEITGNAYIGGVVGLGKNLKDNCTMVNVVSDDGEWQGSIAGDRDENGEVSGNLYVDDGLGAIDGITFHEEAAGITYEELLKIEDLPEEFHSLTVTFLADGQVVERVTCAYGSALEAEAMPDVPVKAGFFDYWEQVDLSDIRRNYKVNAVYVPWTTTIACSDEPKPLLLAEGNYYSGAKLVVTEVDEAEWGQTVTSVPAGHHIEKIVTYEVQDPENPNPAQSVKLHVMAGGAKRVGIVKNGQIQTVEAVKDGDYLEFEADISGQIVMMSVSLIWPAVAGGVLLAIILLVILKQKRKHSEPSKEKTA